MKPNSVLTVTCALTLSLGLIHALSCFAQDLPKGCPSMDRTVKLSTGQEVSLPLCAADSVHLSLITYADLAATNELLASHQLYAVPVQGKALLTIAAIDYKESTIGPYKEVIVGVMASRTQNLSGGFRRFLEFSDFDPLAPPRTHGAFVVKLWVDSELALRAGNEIWGFNKDMGKISVSKDEGFRIEDAEGALVLRSEWKGQAGAPIPFGQNLSFYTITQSGAWAPARYQGTAWIGKFGKADTLVFGDSEWGRKLGGMGITPSLKLTVPKSRLQFHAAR